MSILKQFSIINNSNVQDIMSSPLYFETFL